MFEFRGVVFQPNNRLENPSKDLDILLKLLNTTGSPMSKSCVLLKFVDCSTLFIVEIFDNVLRCCCSFQILDIFRIFSKSLDSILVFYYRRPLHDSNLVWWMLVFVYGNDCWAIIVEFKTHSALSFVDNHNCLFWKLVPAISGFGLSFDCSILWFCQGIQRKIFRTESTRSRSFIFSLLQEDLSGKLRLRH